jgi:hypothetical protein
MGLHDIRGRPQFLLLDGYMGYQFGLIVLLFYLSLPGEFRTAIFPVLMISVLAFFAHGIIFASILVFMGIYCLFFGSKPSSSDEKRL